MSETEAPKKTEKEYLELLVALEKESNSLKESIKDVKDAAKDAGYDHVALSCVAKAIAKAAEAELVEKSQKLIDTVEIYTG